MTGRIALLLTILIHADIAVGQSTLIHEWTGRGFCPHRAKFTPDGRYVLMVGSWTGDAAGDQPELRAWDVHREEFIAEHRLEGHGRIVAVDIAPDGETLLVGTVSHAGRERYRDRNVVVMNHQVWLWNWQATPVRPRSTRVRSSLAPIRRLAVVQFRDPALGAWIWGEATFSPDADLIAVRRVVTVPHGNWPALRHYSEIDILDPSGQLVATVTPPDPLNASTHGMSFSNDGRRLATSTLFVTKPGELRVERIELRLWDVANGDELAQRSVPAGQLRQGGSVHSQFDRLVFSPDGTLIASDGPGGAVQLWDADTLEPLRTLDGPARALHAVAFSPDGTLIAASSVGTPIGSYGEFFLWRTSTGELLYEIDAEEHGPEIYDVAFSPDGATLLTHGPAEPIAGSAVRLWDVNHLLAIGATAD